MINARVVWREQMVLGLETHTSDEIGKQVLLQRQSLIMPTAKIPSNLGSNFKCVCLSITHPCLMIAEMLWNCEVNDNTMIKTSAICVCTALHTST